MNDDTDTGAIDALAPFLLEVDHQARLVSQFDDEMRAVVGLLAGAG
jgi:hypothetical protein